MGHLVVGTSQLEAKDGEKVFTLEIHLAFQAIAEISRMCERRPFDYIVNARRQDESQVLAYCQRAAMNASSPTVLHRDSQWAASSALERLQRPLCLWRSQALESDLQHTRSVRGWMLQADDAPMCH